MPAERESAIWSCQVCLDQFFGGPRCMLHNPPPEERGALQAGPVAGAVRSRDDRPPEQGLFSPPCSAPAGADGQLEEWAF